MKRAEFIYKMSSLMLMNYFESPVLKLGKSNQVIKIGVVADVHQDIIHDGFSRISYFIDQMNEIQPDFIIQLGDFALPRKQNQHFLDKWNSFKGVRYHVLGNHDMRDFGFTKEETMNWWDMKERFYSFDLKDIHFIILDGNDENPKPWTGYNRYIGDQQLKWLESDLEKTNKPSIIFSHQSLEAKGGIENRLMIQKIMNSHNSKNGKKSKVIACFSGHHHEDYFKKTDETYFIQINSMSYKWVGDNYQYKRFPDHIEKTFPMVSRTCPYLEPLFSVIEIDKKNQTLKVFGNKTTFIPPTPKDLGIKDHHKMKPTISDLNLTT